jgi:hypothetical protein
MSGITIHPSRSTRAGLSVSQKVEVAVVQSRKLKRELEEIAAAKRQQIVHEAKEYFAEMLKQSVNFIDKGALEVTTARVASRKGKKRNRLSRFSAKISRRLATQQRESITMDVDWRVLSYRYREQYPRSIAFFLKRKEAYNRPDLLQKSTGLAFITNFRHIKAIKDRVRLTSTYQKDKIKDLKYNWKGRGNQRILSYGFTINYPNLGPRYDTLRQAFIHGAQVGDMDDSAKVKIKHYDSNDYGIARAENERPLLRPFSAKVGAAFRDRLKNLETPPTRKTRKKRK